MSEIIELLKYCMSSFWTFCGVIILISVCGQVITAIISSILFGIFHREGNMHIGDKTEQIITKTEKKDIGE